MASVGAAIGRPMGAEDICDLKLGAGHPGGMSARPSARINQQIEWACHTLDRFGCHFGVDCCRLQFGVPQKHLNDPDVSAAFQKMGGKAVPQSMGRDFLLDPNKIAGQGKGTVELPGRDRDRSGYALGTSSLQAGPHDNTHAA